MQSDLNTFLEWVSQHLHVIGWTAVVAGVWKFTRFFTKLEERWKAAEGHVTKMASNELPHIQASMESIDENVKGLRQDIRDLFIRRGGHAE